MRHMIPQHWRALCVSMILGCSASNLVQAAENYTFGVFPHLPPADIERIFAPMAKELSDAVGKPVKFTSATSFAAFKARLMEEELDIAFLQPFDYVTLADELGYIPVASRGENLRALFVVRPDSNIRKLSDLKGKKIATPPRIAAVSYLIKSHLRENGIDPNKDVRIIYRRSHISCMQQVQIKAVDACGTAYPPLRVFKNKMNKPLDIIAETDPIPHALFAVHPRVSKEDREKIQQRVITWTSTDTGKKILQQGFFKPFKPIDDKAYDIVRKMKRENK